MYCLEVMVWETVSKASQCCRLVLIGQHGGRNTVFGQIIQQRWNPLVNGDFVFPDRLVDLFDERPVDQWRRLLEQLRVGRDSRNPRATADECRETV